MNRSKQMDDFLQYWAEIYQQNPNYPINKEILYKSLMEFGLTAQERQNPSIEGMFSAWETHFQNNPSLYVYQDNRQPLFLQFMSKGDLGKQHVKLYLSYPPDKIEYCVKKIFEFVAANRMVTGSKVANRVRSDSVVLRMTNYDDAVKVINFVSNDPELVHYAKPTNPFMMKQGVVGVSYDDNLSFNGTLALMLTQYFEQCRSTNNLQRANHRHFGEYVNQYLNSVFKNAESLQKFKNIREVSQMLHRFSSVGDALVNYEQVLRLIAMQSDDRMNMDRFRSFYVEAKNSSKNRQMANYYNQLLNGQVKVSSNLERTASMEEIAIINGYIEFAIRKYGRKEDVIAYLNKYIKEENIKAITRDGGFREKFISGMTPQRAKFIMSDNVEVYVNQILQPVKEETETEVEPKISSEEKLLQDYIDLARKKYGDGGIFCYLSHYCENHLTAITKEDNFRIRFAQQLTPEKVLKITNQNVQEYIYSYIRSKCQSTLIDSVMYDNFVGACVGTYQKYGAAQLEEAMKRGQNGDYSHFTNGTGRYRLNMDILTPEMFGQCCKQLISTYGTNLSVASDMPKLYCEIIAQMLQTQKEETKMIS